MGAVGTTASLAGGELQPRGGLLHVEKVQHQNDQVPRNHGQKDGAPLAVIAVVGQVVQHDGQIEPEHA